MKGLLYIENNLLGEANFKIIDESMGVIGGEFVPNNNYEKYKILIQNHCNQKGISNFSDFNYRVLLEDKTELKPDGGIGITDLKDFEEIYIEISGLERQYILKCI